jgi:hypothetical protein
MQDIYPRGHNLEGINLESGKCNKLNNFLLQISISHYKIQKMKNKNKLTWKKK